MKGQFSRRYTARVITMWTLITLISVSSNAQTDPACRQRQFGRFSEWSAPLNLGPAVNSPNLDWWPAISPNGLSLYFGSNRPGGSLARIGRTSGVSRRASLDAPWGEARNLGTNINTEFRDNSPRLSRDGHWLIFGSSRPTGKCVAGSAVELFISYRENTDDDFAWEPAVNFGCEINTAVYNLAPTFFHDDDKGVTTMYFSQSRNVLDFDVYASTRGFHGAFGAPALVPELSSPGGEPSPLIRADGLEMFLKWNGGVTTGGAFLGDVSVATRETTSHPWTTPENLGSTINSPADDDMPTLSCDGTTLYFASNRPGGVGGYDIYVATRKRLDEPEPVLLSASQDGSRQGAILHASTSQVVSSANPASIGEVLEVYLTGLVDGSTAFPQISIGDRAAEILFFGKAPTSAGLNQVNVRVPDISPGPAVPVRLTYLGRVSNEVTIAVR